MIDLHTHILPGLDDGPSTMAQAIAMARTAQLGGVRTAVATPHIREDYPFPIQLVEARLGELEAALADEGIPLVLKSGGEVAISMAAELDDNDLRKLCLGAGTYLLVESPYSLVTGLLERTLFDLQVRGFRPVLAHPERSRTFLAEPARLEALVGRGILSSVTAGSLEGRFGTAILRFAIGLLDQGLVHNIASDAHDDRRRSPLRHVALESLHAKLPALADLDRWLTTDVPAAVISGADLPPRPATGSRRGRLPRLFRGRRDR